MGKKKKFTIAVHRGNENLDEEILQLLVDHINERAMEEHGEAIIELKPPKKLKKPQYKKFGKAMNE